MSKEIKEFKAENGESKIHKVSEEKDKIRLYPERASVGIVSKVEKLKKFEFGELKKIELSEIERKELLEFEDGLGEKLEKIFTIKTKNVFFYLEYFMTEKGRRDFADSIGMEIEGETLEEIE